MPQGAKLGDFVKMSVFTKARQLEEEEDLELENASLQLVDQAVSCDNENWVEEFEAKHANLERVPVKEKHQKNSTTRSATQPKGVARAASKKLAGLPNARKERSEIGRGPGDEGISDKDCRVMEVIYPECAEILATDAAVPRYTTLKVVLDSGAGVHVINKIDAPGCQVSPSAMSRAGAAFLAADGGKITNHGEVFVNMIATDSAGATHPISSRFEAADVTRALWSVGLICDSGLAVKFSSDKAIVADQDGKELCVFHRSNGLYIAEVQIENPMAEGFQRPGM